jgi:hypothetical protein
VAGERPRNLRRRQGFQYALPHQRLQDDEDEERPDDDADIQGSLGIACFLLGRR